VRVVFLGTPEFAVPSLEALAGEHEVAAVFTQPDRPKGRGNQLAESAVKVAARELGITVYQPERVRRPEIVSSEEHFVMWEYRLSPRRAVRLRDGMSKARAARR